MTSDDMNITLRACSGLADCGLTDMATGSDSPVREEASTRRSLACTAVNHPSSAYYSQVMRAWVNVIV